jgi:3-hydroxyacyl-[acyl-carrier-protein] dehydratase
MNELEKLFQLEFQRETGGVCRFRCETDSRHPLFAGHFPGMPVVPGVCLLNAVKRAISQRLGREVTFWKIRECKFLSAINPVENSSFDIEFELTGEQQEVRAGIFTGLTQCMKLKATLFCEWKNI